MCGIAGILRPRLPAERAGERVRAMASRLAHRGPDQQGCVSVGPIHLAHARLGIIDIAGGIQPMANEDGSIWIVINGEIFNYIELRGDLARRGHRFRTQSDTEVVIHLYEDRGPAFVDELEGQFALAIWDAPRERLLLARDRFGICPLHYIRRGEEIAFASEMKAFLVDPEFRFEIDPEALAQVFTFWTVLPPRTIFSGIEALPAGCTLVADGGGARLRRYWDLCFPEEGEEDVRRARAFEEEIRETLLDAARIRLRADVPVGAYLSGGLDSSIVATAVRRFTDAPIETFSITFADPDYDEAPYQEMVSVELETRHHAVHCTYEDIGRVFPAVIWHGEKPILRTAPAPLFLLSALVRERGFKVVLTGEGADELFGGYDIFKEAKIRRFWARRPGSAARAELLRRLYPYDPRLREGGELLAAFYRRTLSSPEDWAFSHRPTWENTRALFGLLSPEFRRRIEGYDPIEELRASLPDGFARWHPLSRAQYLESRILMGEYLLNSQGDRVAMAHAVEGRFPFLDRRVAELAARIPPHAKLLGLREKFALKGAFRRHLPEAVLRRIKRPYGAPNKESFFAGPLPWRDELLSPEAIRRAGIFDPAKAAALLKKCARGERVGFRDNAGFVGLASTSLVESLFVRRRPLADHEIP